MCRRRPRTPASGSPAERPELADVFRVFGDRCAAAQRLTAVQHQARRAIERCRTGALGGHLAVCDRCGHEVAVYHSCRNRHCPRRQSAARERWLAAREAELLPIPYFHVVFTLPHELGVLARGHPRLVYDLLFRAASATLLRFGDDPRHLGGAIGVVAILHTWGQTLVQHLHLHCVVTGGALARDGARWIPARRGFLFPVRALSLVFRGRFLDALEHAFADGRFHFTGALAKLHDPAEFARMTRHLRRKKWVVYAKRPFAGPLQVLRYLGRYTHRIALTNDRLVALDAQTVRFTWKDYADRAQRKTMTLDGVEFLRRFLLHVVPRGFVRIRHYGLLANARKAATLARCRQLLGGSTETDRPEPCASSAELLAARGGYDVTPCPACRAGHLVLTRSIDPTPLPLPTSRAPPSERTA